MREYDVVRVWGIPIRVHVSLLVILPILAYLIGSGTQIEIYAGIIGGLAGRSLDVAALTAGWTPWIIGSLAAVGLFVSVLLHELGHSWVALRYGLEVESITLWILGGLANLGSIPREWNKELWIAVAGPAVSILVGVACALALQTLPRGIPVVTFVVGWLAVTNIVLAVFNMLPAFPMDGGRVLRAILARSMSYGAATRTAALIGRVFAVGFAFVGILPPFSPLLLLLAWFVYSAASGEARFVALTDMLEGVTVGDLATSRSVDAGDSVAALVTRMFDDRQTSYAVLEGGSVVGAVSVEDFQSLSQAERESTTVGSLAERDLPRFEADTPAIDALIELDRSRASEAFVDEPGEVRIVTRGDFADALTMRQVVGRNEPF